MTVLLKDKAGMDGFDGMGRLAGISGFAGLG